MQMQGLHSKHIVIIIEGFPVPLFRILMQQAITLKQNGADVSIISPKMFGLNKRFEILDGIEIYRHPMPLEANSALGFFLEYSLAIFWQFFLLIKIYLRKKIDCIEGCTPPDLVFLSALPFKILGVKYVYYQLDLNPELYVSKFRKKGLFYKTLLILERLTFLCANHIIVPNESFKSIAMKRGRIKTDQITIVRSGPNLENIKSSLGDSSYKHGKKYLVGYLGVICKQDSLDYLMNIIKSIVSIRKDVHFAIIGDGPDLSHIKELATTLQIQQYITFFGMINDMKLLCNILSTCDVCVNPDNPNEFNDKITSIKIMEYMALKKPIVQFDLTEGKFTAQQASFYAEKGNCADFSSRILQLLDNEDLRNSMGEFGYKRVVNQLSWTSESSKLVSLYNNLFSQYSTESSQ